MKSFTFRLPVKKYIYKYLTTLHGDTIPAQMDTDIGFVILNTLASRIEGKVCRGYNGQFKNPWQSSITFTVPYHYFYLTKKQVSVHTVILLNRYFENKFEQDLINHVEKELLIGRKLKAAIESFASFHGIEIEEDISFDALKKMEYRSRKKNAELFLRRLSPVNNLFTGTALTA